MVFKRCFQNIKNECVWNCMKWNENQLQGHLRQGSEGPSSFLSCLFWIYSGTRDSDGSGGQCFGFRILNLCIVKYVRGRELGEGISWKLQVQWSAGRSWKILPSLLTVLPWLKSRVIGPFLSEYKNHSTKRTSRNTAFLLLKVMPLISSIRLRYCPPPP